MMDMETDQDRFVSVRQLVIVMEGLHLILRECRHQEAIHSNRHLNKVMEDPQIHQEVPRVAIVNPTKMAVIMMVEVL